MGRLLALTLLDSWGVQQLTPCVTKAWLADLVIKGGCWRQKPSHSQDPERQDAHTAGDGRRVAPSQWGLWELGTWGRQEEGRAWEAPWTWSWRAKVSATLCEGCWEECSAWPAHRTSGRKLSGARPAQGPGGTVQQEPLGQTWWAELLSCLSGLLLLFKVKSWGKCPARACNRFVLVVCGVCAYVLR